MMNEMKPPDDREYIEALMMDALDGNLSKSGERELNTYLAGNPDMANELAGMQEVNALFADVEMVEPSADFVANTMDMLPRPSTSRWVVGVGFALALFVALAPLAGLTYLFSNLPAQATVLQLTESILNGLAQLVLSFSELASSQPISYLIPIAMVGSILLWAAVYRRTVGAILPARS